MTSRDKARALAEKHIAAGDPLGWFEALYQSASGDAAGICWADLAPNANLTVWLDRQNHSRDRRALVVGCGLGDDAEELARRGFVVTAFDVSASAVAWCNRRFPESVVKYVTADLLSPPAEWTGTFDLIVEIYTLQVLPAELRVVGMENLARFLAPGGELLVICRGREPQDPAGTMPWPLTKTELQPLETRLKLIFFEDFMDGEENPVRRFRYVYRRPAT